MKKIIIPVLAIIGILVAIFIYKNQKPVVPIVTNDFSHVPTDNELMNNMKVAGLDTLYSEGTALHTHQHLDIIINGQNMPIPANVGVGSYFISPLHIHDNTSVLHVESPVVKTFTLGQFFEEWGVKLDNNCIGNYCTDTNNKFVIAVNGTPVDEPQNYVLNQHDEIELWYGPKNDTPSFIKTFDFAPGL